MVRDGLERIVRSAFLARSRQLLGLLVFITEETLAGHGPALKAYTIATLALGRRADFDPQRDAIVRTEARRLRLALERYYAGPGRLDPIRIVLPLGRYVPVFSADGHASIGHAPVRHASAARDTVVVPRSAYLDFVATFVLRARARDATAIEPGAAPAASRRPLSGRDASARPRLARAS